MPTEFLTAYLSASPVQREAALDALRGKLNHVGVKVDERPMPQVLSFAETAKLTSTSKRMLRYYAARGLLEAVRFGGSSRARGYTEASVRRFIEGASREAETRATEARESEVA